MASEKHPSVQRIYSIKYRSAEGKSTHLEYLRDGCVEVFPLLAVEVLQLSGVLVLALVRHVCSKVQLGLGLRNHKREEPVL